MPKKKDPPKAEIPEWVVTYGDLMSLLLCFFILLAAFSELKQEREYQDVVRSIQQAFGYQGGLGTAPTDGPPANSVVSLRDQLRQLDASSKQSSSQNQQNVTGREQSVQHLHEGDRQPIGGSVMFDPGSAELTGEGERLLLESVAPLIRGRQYKVAIRGHAYGHSDLKGGLSLMDLSYERAKAVAEYLSGAGGVERQVLMPVACGDTEPIDASRDSLSPSPNNRRVEIVVTEVTVDEVHPDPHGTGRN